MGGELTRDDVLRSRRSALVVFHHLQFDLVLLTRTQTGLLKAGLWAAEGVQDLTVLLFLPNGIFQLKKVFHLVSAGRDRMQDVLHDATHCVPEDQVPAIKWDIQWIPLHFH